MFGLVCQAAKIINKKKDLFQPKLKIKYRFVKIGDIFPILRDKNMQKNLESLKPMAT